MTKYIIISRLTDDGAKTLKRNSSRIKEVNKEVEKMGVTILSQYALLGAYDFVNIIEAPSDEVAAKIAIRLSATGAVQPLTLAAISLDRLIEALKEEPRTPW